DASKRTSYVVEVDFLARRSNRPCIVKKVANEIPIRLWAKKEAMTMTSSAAKSEKAKGHLRPLAVMSNVCALLCFSLFCLVLGQWLNCCRFWNEMLYDCSFFIGNGSVHPYPPTERATLLLLTFASTNFCSDN
ncbi:hypothetical protein M514_13904, partial [Trichuris suis]